MTSKPHYSDLFSTLYDETKPVGHLGRGTHYSVFRTVEWLDVTRTPIAKPQIHDFSVIWDEDHDERIIPIIENAYMEGLLSPVQFIGERKGSLTVIVASKFYHAPMGLTIAEYQTKFEKIANMFEDSWPVRIGMFDRVAPQAMPHGGVVDHQFECQSIIHDNDSKVKIYLRNIDSLWDLGTKDFVLNREAQVTLNSPVAAPIFQQ